jgi:hypothetical protein
MTSGLMPFFGWVFGRTSIKTGGEALEKALPKGLLVVFCSF